MEGFAPIRLKKNDNPLWKALIRLGRKRKIEFYEATKYTTLKGFCLSLEGFKLILINKNIEDIEFKCYVLAHEIGHAILHEVKFEQKLYFDDEEYKAKKEEEANRFANKLIGLLKRKLQAEKSKSIARVG